MSDRTLLSDPTSLAWAKWIRILMEGALGIGVLAAGAGAVLSPNGVNRVSTPALSWLFFFVISAIWILFHKVMKKELGGLKAVSMDKDFLYVSDAANESSIPLSSIASVTENRWMSSHPITVTFRTPTAFGPEITFTPQPRVTFSLTGYQPSHPVVARLKNAANSRMS